ncbi:hypothetical protein G6F46_009940 [Rhizopus delemar]|uniref:Uncharacterized protein n=2 Tax=Rhizopus TaxID=4842 RepID=A0A9P6YXZ4_9FUNG|nr:hypothetical protein G6F55_009042 [Rhizopus delemar]KAG1539889.1 hypothetical protein G6F51_008859 [Rhizopus arrhizus]KAG1492187.1 hypothetical protein G6F54_009487 [Rhizopus delemar]KAG1507256.1 hypothetical protein G6F53_009087 [Rhizopus delemar]KAG1522086.1 hypothetical protein G6F52_006166 [Rhizopus delemar]
MPLPSFTDTYNVHSIHRLNMHRRLQLPETMVDPLSFLDSLNGLLSVPSSISLTTYAMTRFHLHHHPILGEDSSNGFPMSPASVSYTLTAIARNLVSFLIHIGYETELRSQLSKFNITVRDDFDPLDPSIIRDPTLVNEPIDRKVHHARKAFLHRIRVALRRFRTLIYNAVTNFFVQFGLIGLDNLASYDLVPPYKYCTGHILDHV